jgi:hypothetical protein
MPRPLATYLREVFFPVTGVSRARLGCIGTNSAVCPLVAPALFLGAASTGGADAVLFLSVPAPLAR